MNLKTLQLQQPRSSLIILEVVTTIQSQLAQSPYPIPMSSDPDQKDDAETWDMYDTDHTKDDPNRFCVYTLYLSLRAAGEIPLFDKVMREGKGRWRLAKIKKDHEAEAKRLHDLGYKGYLRGLEQSLHGNHVGLVWRIVEKYVGFKPHYVRDWKKEKEERVRIL